MELINQELYKHNNGVLVLGGARLASQQDEDLVLDPVLALGDVDVRLVVEDKAAEVRETVDELEESADVVGDARDVRVELLEVLLVDLADRLHALVRALVVRPGARLHFGARLHQQNGVRHADLNRLVQERLRI